VVSSAGGAGDNTVHFWDDHTGKEVLRYHEDLGEIYGLSISPDGRWLLTNGGYSKAACLYRLPKSLWPVKSEQALPADGK
jgi:WD40 repeat protein